LRGQSVDGFGRQPEAVLAAAAAFGLVFEGGWQKQGGINTRLGDDMNAALPQG